MFYATSTYNSQRLRNSGIGQPRQQPQRPLNTVFDRDLRLFPHSYSLDREYSIPSRCGRQAGSAGIAGIHVQPGPSPVADGPAAPVPKTGVIRSSIAGVLHSQGQLQVSASRVAWSCQAQRHKRGSGKSDAGSALGPIRNSRRRFHLTGQNV